MQIKYIVLLPSSFAEIMLTKANKLEANAKQMGLDINEAIKKSDEN